LACHAAYDPAMSLRRGPPMIRYRCSVAEGQPPPGTILMGDGQRVRRAYRILGATAVRNGLPMIGFVTWKLAVEPMPAERGREEIEAGVPHWTIVWHRRAKK
jgi:hypothetical protein